MSNSVKGNGIGQIIKALVVTSFRLLVIAIAFTCRIAGILLTKISELFEKLSGHDPTH